jgi:hypothetical protein
MNTYFVKKAAKLSLEIVKCDADTRAALVRQARRSGESITQYLENVVLGMLESDEQYTPAEEPV